MDPLRQVILVIIVVLVIARFAIARQQKRRKKMRALHRLVGVRYQASADFRGDLSDFEEAIQEVRRTFRDVPAVISALDRFRDHRVAADKEHLATAELGQAIKAMCRDLKMDESTVGLGLD
jgi:hypothetical protein